MAYVSPNYKTKKALKAAEWVVIPERWSDGTDTRTTIIYIGEGIDGAPINMRCANEQDAADLCAALNKLCCRVD